MKYYVLIHDTVYDLFILELSVSWLLHLSGLSLVGLSTQFSLAYCVVWMRGLDILCGLDILFG